MASYLDEVIYFKGVTHYYMNELDTAIKYLRNGNIADDEYSVEFANVAIFFGILGFMTGSLWGQFTWGDWLPKDPKIIAVEVGLLIYSSYFILRSSFEDEQRRARLSAIYNIFAFVFYPIHSTNCPFH
jgi:heme exporter protein C